MSNKDALTVKAARTMLVISCLAALVCLAAMVFHGVAGNLIGAAASVFVSAVCIGLGLLFSTVEDNIIERNKS